MKTVITKKLTSVVWATLISLVLNCPALGYPADPHNAALLYYQAFCVYEKPDDTMKDMIRGLANGRIEPNPTITKYIESCRPAIKLAASAGKLVKCDWGLKYSDGLDMQARHLAETRMLTHIILADGRTALTRADYDLAILRCLTARRLALHTAEDPTAISFLVEKSIERITNKCIQDILSSRAMELKTLEHLKVQLDELDSRFKSVEFFLETEQEVMAMYTTPDRIRELLPYINPENTPRLVNASDDVRKYILNADEQFCQRNLAYYNEHWNAVFSALELPYQQAYNKLKGLDERAAEDYKENPDAFIAVLLAPAVWKIYNNGVQSTTFSNALNTATEIYMITARTGQLPDSPPAGLPKDLFSGEDFEYEKTDEGFVLRCQGKDLEEDKVHEYEFKIRK
jgi:hypothetical protein